MFTVLTFNEFRQEVGGCFGLLDSIALHHLTLAVDPDVPGPAWLSLPVKDGGVGHVVILKHTLFELALRGEVFLQTNKPAAVSAPCWKPRAIPQKPPKFIRQTRKAQVYKIYIVFGFSRKVNTR